jgi:hypothetical protein
VRRLAALCCLVAFGALAEEPAPPTEEDAAARPAANAPATGQRSPANAKPAATPAGTGKSPERFDPSEEISEDLSVSFPADI